VNLKVKQRLRRAPTWLRNKYWPGGLILMYHRVVELTLDPFELSVTPQHFSEHMEVLRKYSRPVSLGEMACLLREGRRPHRMVAVTFDDGYTDNLYNAKPLLERHDVPGTVFVTTAHIGEQKEFMWDELERLLLQPGTLPEALKLQVRGDTVEWQLGRAAHYSEEEYLSHSGWDAQQSDDPSPRHSIYRSLHQLLKPLTRSEQQRSMEQLLAWSGMEATGRETHRTMTATEVRQLADGGIVEVGSHTVTHQALSQLTPSEQHAELEQSKATLEEILERPVKTFAYPFGGKEDYTTETVALVRETGYDCACSNFPGIVRRDTDLFQLPRLGVHNWDGDEFERLIRWLALG
jgi:peptidoglycan/xylan/chitin deacetylase (PgdA/CDA1 family)